jgi:hypothetical protein
MAKKKKAAKKKAVKKKTVKKKKVVKKKTAARRKTKGAEENKQLTLPGIETKSYEDAPSEAYESLEDDEILDEDFDAEDDVIF